MKPRLILLSHGQFAEQARVSAEMIVGEIDGLYAICMLASDGLEGTKKKLRLALGEIGADTPAIIIVDILGGTPCNAAVEATLERKNIRVIAGLNLPMVIEYAVADDEDLDEMTAFLCEIGLGAVKILEAPQLTDGEGDGYED